VVLAAFPVSVESGLAAAGVVALVIQQSLSLAPVVRESVM
jgi:hypothetical protein